MAITTTSLFDRHSLQIQEVINKSITVFMASLDPVWRDLISTSQGVGNQGELGRDLIMIKIFMGSFAGVLEQGAVYNDIDLYGDLTSQLGPRMHQQQLNEVYPDPRSGPNATPYRLAVGMRSMPFNIMLTQGERQAEATPAFIGSVIGPKLQGAARMMSHTLCNYWYLSQNDDYRLAAITAVSAVSTVTIGSQTAFRFTFEPDNFATWRFRTGQRIDIYDSTGTNRINDSQASTVDQTQSTRLQLVVESSAPLKNIVSVICPDFPQASGDWNADPANNQIIVYANSKLGAGSFTGFAGVNSWLKAGDTNGATDNDFNLLLGTAEAHATDRINVNVHPEFASFLKSSVGTLTEHKLRQYLARVHASWDPLGKDIDTLVASDGVWLHYEAQKIGQFRIDRTDRASSLRNEGSRKGFMLTFDGRDYTGFTSTIVENQTLYGLKRGNNNWKRYVPPSPRGTTKMSQVDSYVPFEFVGGGLQGNTNPVMPIYSVVTSGATGITLPTEGSQMPGRIRMQLVPDQPNMIKLTGLTEDREYGDDDS